MLATWSAVYVYPIESPGCWPQRRVNVYSDQHDCPICEGYFGSVNLSPWGLP